MSEKTDKKHLKGLTSNDLETEYVHDVYDSIATHFSSTRHKPWPKVSQFLNELPNGSLVLDVGCGNGKYMNCNSNIYMIGCDRSSQLLGICKQRSYEVFMGDCLQLSIRDRFDACICIAVLHHLSSIDRRIKALQLIINLLEISGKALIYVWAFEQKNGENGVTTNYLRPNRCKHNEEITNDNEMNCDLNITVHQNRTQFKQQDLLVPWKSAKAVNNEHLLRFYHVFKKGELEHLICDISNAKLIDSYYDDGNWCAIVERVS